MACAPCSAAPPSRLSLGLGIGANTAIFSFLDAVLLRNLPVQQPSRLVLLGDGSDTGISDAWAGANLYSYPFYRDLQKNNFVFSSTASSASPTPSTGSSPVATVPSR